MLDASIRVDLREVMELAGEYDSRGSLVDSRVASHRHATHRSPHHHSAHRSPLLTRRTQKEKRSRSSGRTTTTAAAAADSNLTTIPRRRSQTIFPKLHHHPNPNQPNDPNQHPNHLNSRSHYFSSITMWMDIFEYISGDES